MIDKEYKTSMSLRRTKDKITYFCFSVLYVNDFLCIILQRNALTILNKLTFEFIFIWSSHKIDNRQKTKWHISFFSLI